MTRMAICFPIGMCLVLLAAAFPAAGKEGAETPENTALLSSASLLLGAHRCGRGEWPENTLVAVREASRRWPDIVLEVDAQLTSDGHVVLMHDFGVDRTTNGSGYVGGMTLEAIRALDGAYHFSTDGGKTFPYRGTGVTVPTLDEAFAAAPNHRFFIEMKDGAQIGRATAEAIQRAGAEARCLVASVSPLFLEEFRAVAPDVATVYDFISAADMLAALRGGDAWNAYKPAHRVLALSHTLRKRFEITPKELDSIREKGILVSMFTLNTREDILKALDLGVDNILTDKPSLLADVLEEEDAKTSPAGDGTAEDRQS